MTTQPSLLPGVSGSLYVQIDQWFSDNLLERLETVCQISR